MHSSVLVAALACCQAVVAAPTEGPAYGHPSYSPAHIPCDDHSCSHHDPYSGYEAKSYIDKFDDLPQSIISLSPVKKYGGLNYKAFFSATPSKLTGPQPHSPSNVVAYGAYGSLLQGAPILSPIESNSIFDLHSFYFGCAINTAETAAGVPSTCTVTVTGYDGTRKIGSEEFKFTPEGILDLKPDFQLAEFGKWAKGMTSAEFETSNGLLTGTLLDDFAYTVYTKE
ncbi:uncharacterized protein RCC_01253 [Ramularia collo-cygni]|uniref:Uncharacterized protein n=1 Tax=Ramularia collo-cygni TaxID=112498 RepID=A0A2D3V1L5_9PEZI|nr:uncharacterized protein RCC_01253 [Ramularia collo-cygni]CZT15389.1 uncharacterized protein RCC_01253 [Ramularia collo-cygni]